MSMYESGGGLSDKARPAQATRPMSRLQAVHRVIQNDNERLTSFVTHAERVAQNYAQSRRPDATRIFDLEKLAVVVFELVVVPSDETNELLQDHYMQLSRGKHTSKRTVRRPSGRVVHTEKEVESSMAANLRRIDEDMVPDLVRDAESLRFHGDQPLVGVASKVATTARPVAHAMSTGFALEIDGALGEMFDSKYNVIRIGSGGTKLGKQLPNPEDLQGSVTQLPIGYFDVDPTDTDVHQEIIEQLSVQIPVYGIEFAPLSWKLETVSERAD